MGIGVQQDTDSGTIADCAALPNAKLHKLNTETAAQLWPQLLAAMRAAGRPWPALVPGDSFLSLLPLESVAALAAWPEGLHTLQAQGIVDAAELQRFHSFPLAKRRLEWLAGRLAAKAALQQYCAARNPQRTQASPASFVIDNDGYGRPFFARPLRCQQPFLSISHSQGLAAALVAPVPCGLDLQAMHGKLLRLRARFASPAEQALGSGYDTLVWLGMLWVAKEAVKKCHYHDQPTFMERIRVVAHRGCATGAQAATLSCRLADRAGLVRVRVAVCGDYAMAVNLGGADAGAA